MSYVNASLLDLRTKNIIVIGCDKTGKSTLIDSLLDSFVAVEYYKGNNQKTPEMAFGRALDFVRANKHFPTILDRFHFPDDLVYHPVMSGSPMPEKIEQAYYTWVYPELVNQGTIFIYCHASEETITRRFKEEGEKLIKPEMIRDLLAGYNDIIKNLEKQFPILKLNSDILTKEEMHGEAKTFIIDHSKGGIE